MAFATFCTGKCRLVWWRIESMVTRSRCVELGVVLFEGAQDHRVASAAASRSLTLCRSVVVSAHAAAGLEVKTVVARSQPVQRRCLVEHVSERRQLRHGYSSMFKCEVPWFEVSQGADAFARAHVLLRYLAVLPSTQDCGRRPGPHSKSPDFVLPIAFGGVRFVAGRVRRGRVRRPVGLGPQPRCDVRGVQRGSGRGVHTAAPSAADLFAARPPQARSALTREHTVSTI